MSDNTYAAFDDAVACVKSECEELVHGAKETMKKAESKMEDAEEKMLQAESMMADAEDKMFNAESMMSEADKKMNEAKRKMDEAESKTKEANAKIERSNLILSLAEEEVAGIHNAASWNAYTKKKHDERVALLVGSHGSSEDDLPPPLGPDLIQPSLSGESEEHGVDLNEIGGAAVTQSILIARKPSGELMGVGKKAKHENNTKTAADPVFCKYKGPSQQPMLCDNTNSNQWESKVSMEADTV